jgi:hypothetical protein
MQSKLVAPLHLHLMCNGTVGLVAAGCVGIFLQKLYDHSQLAELMKY